MSNVTLEAKLKTLANQYNQVPYKELINARARETISEDLKWYQFVKKYKYRRLYGEMKNEK